MRKSDLGYAGRFLLDYETRRMLQEGVSLLPQPSIIVPPNAVDFPDVSFYQGDIDWNYFSTKSHRVIIRAGQNTWVDPQFERNYTLTGELGFMRGVYWFYDGRAKPSIQTGILVDLLKGREPEMEVFADWERNYGGSYEGLPYVVEFMQRLESDLPTMPFDSGMYTGYYWFLDNTDPIQHATQFNYLKTRPLWLPWYNSPSIVRIPVPWTNWTHWQYGTPVEDYGQRTQEIDKNKFNGDEGVYTVRYGSAPIPEPPPTGETMIHTLKVNTAALNGRAAPNGTIIFQGGFKSGDILLANDPVIDSNGVTNWYPVLQCVRAGVLVPLPASPTYASDGATARYLLVLGSLPCEVVTPPPEPIAFTVTKPGYTPLTLNGILEPE